MFGRLRARLQGSQILRGAALVLAALASLVCLAVVLDLTLPGGSRAKDIASIVQSFAAALAIVVGGIYALYKLQLFRTLEPHLTIEHRISHRRLSDSYMHIDVTAGLHNSSKVKIELRKGLFRLQGISPVLDEEVEILYTETFDEKKYHNIQWPTIEEVERAWAKGELVLEPGESHSETIEYIVALSGYESVLVYTYLYNPSRSRGSAQGWTATTVYDIGVPKLTGET